MDKLWIKVNFRHNKKNTLVRAAARIQYVNTNNNNTSALRLLPRQCVGAA